MLIQSYSYFQPPHVLADSYHLVHTAVTISSDIKGNSSSLQPILSFIQTTKVRFSEIAASDIEAYISSGEPMDKSGGR